MDRSLITVIVLMAALTVGAMAFMLPKAAGSSAERPVESYAQDASGQAREITVEATNFEFTPSTIKVRQGEKVRLTLKNTGGTHGISVPSLGISLRAEAGESKTIEFTADKPGSHPFLCNTFCGPGHTDMTGAIVVEGQQSNSAEELSEIKIRGTASGFSPNTFSVKAGKPVKISFSADSDAGCARIMVVKGTNIKLVSTSGDVSEASFTPTAGNHAFTCAMGMFNGVISAS